MTDVLKHLFWADAENIEDFSKYGEVVTFDTTYNTKIYKSIFGIFCGVNNYLSSILFAFAIISNEVSESFIWLFEEFIKCMKNTPKAIITD